MTVLFQAAIYSLKQTMQNIRAAQPELLTDGITRGQLNERNEALQLEKTKIPSYFPQAERTELQKGIQQGFCVFFPSQLTTGRAQRISAAAFGVLK